MEMTRQPLSYVAFACLAAAAWGLSVPSPRALADDPKLVDERFSARLLEIAKDYQEWGRADSAARMAPTLCRALPPGALRRSRAEDDDAHGQKLYYIYAAKAKDYVPIDGAKPGKQPVGQVLVKESYEAEAVSAEEAKKLEGEAGQDPFYRSSFVRSKAGWLKTGAKKELFIMARLADDQEGSDAGWIYGSVSSDGKTVLTAGRVASCMSCHSKAPVGRIFGLPKD